MAIEVGDKVKATEDYLNEACSAVERKRFAEKEKPGLFGTVLQVNGDNVFWVKWDEPGFSPDYDVAFASEIEKVDD